MLVFVSIYYVNPLEACLFYTEREKGSRSNGRGGRKRQEGVEGLETEIRICYVFSVQRKKNRKKEKTESHT